MMGINNMKLQEHIRRILREELINESHFLRRRVDLDKFKEMLPKGVPYIFYDTRGFDDFKYELVMSTLSNYIFYKYNMELDQLPQEEVNQFIEFLVETFHDLIKQYYDDFVEQKFGKQN
jgi:hypothetical protein